MEASDGLLSQSVQPLLYIQKAIELTNGEKWPLICKKRHPGVAFELRFCKRKKWGVRRGSWAGEKGWRWHYMAVLQQVY
jgi:hypothetical protein